MYDPSLPPHLREFQCPHCQGRIRIPRDLPPTTAPCPHCQAVILSPAPQAAAPAPSPPQTLAYPPAAQPVVQAPAPPPEVPVPAPVSAPTPAPAPSAVQPAPVPSKQQPLPPSEDLRKAQEPVPAITPQPAVLRRLPIEAPPEEKRRIFPAVLLVLLLLGFAGSAFVVAYKELKKKDAAKPLAPIITAAMAEEQFLRIGWQKEAYSTLGKFLAGRTVEEKLPYILNGAELKPQIDSFYGGSTIQDLDTPADAFAAFDLSPEDRKRGIFLLVFDQPPLFDIKEFFQPLASLEVQMEVEEMDMLLSTVSNEKNFSTEPLRVHAFFRRTPDGFKLDWETFAQTKYRLFQTFTELPEPGQSSVFRLIIAEDVPDAANISNDRLKTYRLSDPVSLEVSTRVTVPVDSPIGKTLSELNWIKQQKRPVNRTATVELTWTQDVQPKIEIKRFICWEFLNLGGKEGNASTPPR